MNYDKLHMKCSKKQINSSLALVYHVIKKFEKQWKIKYIGKQGVRKCALRSVNMSWISDEVRHS